MRSALILSLLALMGWSSLVREPPGGLPANDSVARLLLELRRSPFQETLPCDFGHPWSDEVRAAIREVQSGGARNVPPLVRALDDAEYPDYVALLEAMAGLADAVTLTPSLRARLMQLASDTALGNVVPIVASAGLFSGADDAVAQELLKVGANLPPGHDRRTRPLDVLVGLSFWKRPPRFLRARAMRIVRDGVPPFALERTSHDLYLGVFHALDVLSRIGVDSQDDIDYLWHAANAGYWSALHPIVVWGGERDHRLALERLRGTRALHFAQPLTNPGRLPPAIAAELRGWWVSSETDRRRIAIRASWNRIERDVGWRRIVKSALADPNHVWRMEALAAVATAVDLGPWLPLVRRMAREDTKPWLRACARRLLTQRDADRR